jgi:serine/threonine-protein kinase
LSERWQRIGALFDEALAAAAHDRDAVLSASHEPDDIKQEVRSLLAAHESAGDFLESPTALPSSPPPLTPGTQIGAYRVVRVLGRGGMGVVYEAEDTRLHRRVALKSLPPEVSADERQRQRLRQEARAAAALQHPGIATVYALEEIDGHVFISTEYLAGDTLREELQRGPLGAARTLIAARELVQALCAAHERGIVHRDLKPENIVRTGDGALKILDFGLAQFEAPARDLASQSRLTMTGMLAGTPAYMAPEQLLGAEADFRVDHFSLGVMLYELCTGAHPFSGESLPSTIARILAAPPDPPPSSSHIPPALWSVIDRCLRKDPAQRFSSTRDLALALNASAFAGANTGERRRDLAGGLRPGDGGPVEASAEVGAAAGLEGGPIQWWRFHQFAAALTYWAMVWPVWHVHRSFGRAGLFFFFATLATVVVAANLRLHLWFSSRVYPEDLPQQRAEVARWIRWADVAFAALLISGGIALPDDRAGWAALLISFGVGAAVAFAFIEPATTRAALRRFAAPEGEREGGN